MDDDLFSESEYIEDEAAAFSESEAASSVAELSITGDNWNINTDALHQLDLDRSKADAIQATWAAFIRHAESKEAAGEALYSALFESAPSLQPLFVTPRAVQALRFMQGISNFVASVHSGPNLKAAVETLGFGHLNIEVTVPRVIIFRDAIIELLETEAVDAWTTEAKDAWGAMLSYIGGGLIFIKANYAERLRTLAESWKAANSRGEDLQVTEAERQKKEKEEKKQRAAERERKKKEALEEGLDPDNMSEASGDSGGSGESAQSGFSSSSGQQNGQEQESRGAFGSCLRLFRRGGTSADAQAKQGLGSAESSSSKGKNNKEEKMGMGGAAVPKTFEEMFQWNAAVMGLGNREWMQQILENFGAMVTHIADSKRIQQETSVLAIKIGKCNDQGAINLAEFKSCMLAALRQQLPKVWDTAHEVAWNWLWDNIEKQLKSLMGHPLEWEYALHEFMDTLSEEQLYTYRKDLYDRFFTAAPAGQDFFKQSNTRLHFIAEQVTKMTGELYKDPWRMVDEISALGLRHVGFGIPTELFGPFVTATVEVLARYAADYPLALEAFRWSLGLIGQMLVQTITEGSTIVMQAINVNSSAQVQKALSCAPRGDRSKWVLIVEVGTQSISPLFWAIESSSLAAARAMLEDLLTIRADRERYYYGVEDLFRRHADIVQILCADAVSLLPTFLEGLVWRSRTTTDGMRRVNYYVKNLLLDAQGAFPDGIKNLVDVGDPQIISHPVINLCSNALWSGIVMKEFIFSKIWFIVSLVLLISSQTILTEFSDSFAVRCVTLVFRCGTYLLTMLRLMAQHVRDSFRACRAGETVRVFGCIPCPKYLTEAHALCSFFLMLLLVCMCSHEPFFYCAGVADWPREDCPAHVDTSFRYSVFAMVAVALHWVLMADLAVFSTGLSAFVLVCVHVGSEIGRFMFALLFLLMTFASAISVLEHDYEDMTDVTMTLVALFSITLRLYEDDYRDFQHDPILLCAVFAFVTASAVLLLNLLIAQLNCSYVYIYANMVGYARLKRCAVIVETLAHTREDNWSRFHSTLGLDVPLEFGEGDVGMAGGIQDMEPANAHLVTKDRILRFGGSCAAELQWPEDITDKLEDEDEQIAKLEKLLKSALSKMQSDKKQPKKNKSGSSSGGLGSGGMGGSGGGGSGRGSGGGSRGGSGSEREPEDD